MIRRINLWGAPGVGKSTTASWLFANLKISGYQIQFVEEHVKRWAFQNRPVVSFDELYLTACQINTEDEYLRNNIQVITDCPIGISYFFARRKNLPYANIILQMFRLFDEIYPSFNIYLERAVEYQSVGRYETEEESKKYGEEMLDFLQKEYNLFVARPQDCDGILRKLKEVIK